MKLNKYYYSNIAKLALFYFILVSKCSFAFYEASEADIKATYFLKNDETIIDSYNTELLISPNSQVIKERITFENQLLTYNFETNELILNIDNKLVSLAKMEEINPLVTDGSIISLFKLKLEIVNISKGKPFYTLMPKCLPAFGCSYAWEKITPRKIMIEMTTHNQEIVCIKKGYMTNKDNYIKKKSLGDTILNIGKCIR